MASKKVTWLGDNATKRLTNPETGKTVGVGEDIALSAEQIRILKRNGHQFAEPKSDEAEAARQQAGKTPPKAPATT